MFTAVVFLLATVLPQPTGRYAVGVRHISLTDASRQETVSPDVGKRRTFPMVVWYPAASSTAHSAPYATSVVGSVLAQRLGLKTGFENDVQTHAYANAPIAAGPFHVLLLDHGLGMVPEIYTSLATELASNGYVVVAINHTFTSAVAELPAGRRVYTPPWPRDVERAVQGARMGEYVATWVADDRYALDMLDNIAKSLGSRKALDATRVVAIGHSYGGTTAGVLAGTDARVIGAVDLDGSIYPGMGPVVRSKGSVLIMTTPSSASVQDEFRGAEGKTFGGMIRGSNHMTYTDAPLLEAAFADKGNMTDELARTAAVRMGVLEFVNHVVLERPAPLLENVLELNRK